MSEADETVIDFEALARREVDKAGFRLGADSLPLPEAAGVRLPVSEQAFISIDNEDTMDIDQLSFVEPDPDSVLHAVVYVAIADVVSRVPRGSPVDEFAAWNTTTLYLWVDNFWMFPRKLCCDETSLAPGEKRNAIITRFKVHLKTGQLSEPKIWRAQVVNSKKLDYNTVGTFLAGGKFPDTWDRRLQEQLKLHDDVAQALALNRQIHGSLPFSTQKAEPIMDAQTHQPIGVRPTPPQNRANEIIEYLMISANSVNVEFLLSKGFSVIRRVVRDPKRWGKIVEFAEEHDFEDLDENRVSVKDLQKFLRTMGSKLSRDAYKELCLRVIILMGRGEYISDDGKNKENSIGHFALALGSYTHSTAPNRRYPDVVLQRMLIAALNGEKNPYSDAELKDIAEHLTEFEDKATKVERLVTKCLLANVLKTKLGEHFRVTVSQIREDKEQIWVRILEGDFAGCEGRLMSYAAGPLEQGDELHVKLEKADPLQGYIDFVFDDEHGKSRRRASKKKYKRHQKGKKKH